LDDTEEISVGIFEYDEVGFRAISPGIAARAQAQEPVDFFFLVVGVEI
jgi:hypothetical protein